MLNRNQKTLGLLESLFTNPVRETFNDFTNYLRVNYSETVKIVEQYLAERGADLSLEIRELVRVVLVLSDRSIITKAGKKVVVPLCKLLLQFPENTLLMTTLAASFRQGAVFADLQDTMDYKQLFPAEAEGWNPVQLEVYCIGKALMLNQVDHANWTRVGGSLINGVSVAELFSIVDCESLFPSEARSWESAQLAAYCFAKALLINPKEGRCWYNLGVAFMRGAMLANLPMDFLPMIISCIKNVAPANYYCAVSCYEKAVLFIEDGKKKEGYIDRHKKASNALKALEQKIAFVVMEENAPQVQQTPSVLPAQARTRDRNLNMLKSLVHAFSQNLGVKSYNELLRGLVSVRNSYSYDYGYYQYSIEQITNGMPLLRKNLVRAAALLQEPRFMMNMFVSDLGKLVIEHPRVPLLNYCLGASFYKGASWKDLGYTPIGLDHNSLAFAVYFLTRELMLIPENDEAWKMLGSIIANRTTNRFLSLLGMGVVIGNVIPWDCSLKWDESEAYCLAKSLAVHQDIKQKQRLDSLLSSMRDREIIQIIKNIAYPEQASNTLTTLSPLTVNHSLKPDNSLSGKRKFEEVPVSNKIAKINISESPSIQTQTSQHSLVFFRLPNQSVTEGPVLYFDAKKIMEVIKILRGNNYCLINCVHLTRDLLDYFKTGKMPASPSSTASSKPEEFSVLISTDWVEREKGTPYLGVTNSVVDENDFSDFPCDIEIPQTPGGTEGEPILNVDRFTQPSASYNEINDRLKTLAREQKQGVSFGLINVGRCGRYVEDPGHMLLYFATSDSVMYVDAQLFNGEKQLDYGCIFSDLSVYRFADKDRLGPDTFGEQVFYIPCGPHIPELTMVQVKKEPIDERGQYFNF